MPPLKEPHAHSLPISANIIVHELLCPTTNTALLPLGLAKIAYLPRDRPDDDNLAWWLVP